MKHLLITLLLLASLRLHAQLPVNNTTDPNDTEVNSAISFLDQYLHSFTSGKLPNFADYWPESECELYRIPDRMLFAINTEIPTYLLGKPLVLYARPEDGLVHIKTMFSHTDSLGKPLVLSITNHYVATDKKGKHYFTNAMYLSRDRWLTTTVRNVTFTYPQYHTFNKTKAKELTEQTAALEKEWDLPHIPIRYYFADTKMELEQYRGFDFTIAMGNRDKPTGMSDGIDNVIYCGGAGENYFHEVVHLYLNRLFPASPLTEGLAVMYGGSLGHNLQWHVKRLNTYLTNHPSTNLSNLDDFRYMDNFTNPYYTILGLLCQLTYQQNGLSGLKQVMRLKTIDDVLEQAYGITPAERDSKLKEMIAKAAQ